MRITSFIFILALILLNSCETDQDLGSEKNRVKITSNLTSPETWTSNNVYIIEKRDFYVEDELIIEPGTIVKFPAGHGLTLANSLDSQGKIKAIGTSSQPIIFTSYSHDIPIGFNDNSNSSEPQPLEWENIDLNGTEGSVFEYCEFYYGGGGFPERGVLRLRSGSAKIKNCTFAYSGGGVDGNLFYGALNASNANSSTVIQNNLFYGNELPLSMFCEISIDNSNKFVFGNESNKYNGIFIEGSTIGQNVSWAETDVALVITAMNLIIYSGVKLSLGDNVVIKFTDSSTMTLLSGESSLENHNGQGVAFTSFKDDSLKGDTNGDAGASTPQPGDWEGIYLDDFKGAGFADWPNIFYNNPNAVVK